MLQLLLFAVRMYELAILVRVVISWVQADPYNPFVRWVRRITEPVLEPIRRLLPTNSIGIDFSPLIVLLVLELIVPRVLIAVFRPLPF